MSVLHGKNNRRILPRWRVSGKASYSNDFLALKSTKKVQGNIKVQLQQAKLDFIKIPSIGSAAEALSYSLLAGETDAAVSAARFILENENDAPLTLFRLAQSVIDGGNPFSVVGITPAEQVAQTRKLLRINPDNPMLWADMARHYSSLGHRTQASRSMLTALQLAPNHRWILRTAARFFVHQEEPIAAHKLLTNHPGTKNDPWLIAAELACAQVAERPARFWRQATQIIIWDKVHPRHMSELATAVAMMELESGDRKKARKYIKKGLIAPTENTLAQVYWAQENKHLKDGSNLDALVKSATDAFEADYRFNLAKGDLIVALDAAKIWKADEPFAARPCLEIAYIASLLDDYDLTIEIADDVYRLDGFIDFTLEMNIIFAELSSGALDAHHDKKYIEKLHAKLMSAVEKNDSTSYHALANLGLWHYRYGEKSDGQVLYNQAITRAQKANSNEGAAMAATFAAREAILSKEPSADSVLQRANDLAKSSKNEANLFYLRKLEALSRNPWDSPEILSPASAHRFVKKDKQTVPFRVEKTRNGNILWIPKKDSHE